MEYRIAVWLALLFWLLSSIHVEAQEAPKDALKAYKPAGSVMMCQDVQKACIPMLLKDTAIYFAVFSDAGELVAITKVLDGKEEVVWGELKLPLKKGETEL